MSDPPKDTVDAMVEQWAGHMPEAITPRVALAKRLAGANARLADAGQPALDALAIDKGEYDVLATLLRQDKPYELTPTTLTAGTLVTTSGMTKRIDRLENRGLVARRPDPADRRGTLVGLTPAGRKLAREAVLTHGAAVEEALAGIGARDLDALDALLRKLQK